MNQEIGGTAPAREDALSLSWQYPPGMIGLSFWNMALRIVTIGIYHFWAKTEVRQRIWSAIRINDEPLTYTGRGLELFIGFLVVMAVVFLPLFAIIFTLVLTLGPNHPAMNVVSALFYIVGGFLFGLAVYRAQRYRLARTRWRGIRGSLEGNPMAYAWTYFWTAILVPLTLGWIMPWRTTRLQSMVTNNSRLGNRPLRFDAKSGPLYGPYAIAWIGGILTYIAFGAMLYVLLFAKVIAARQQGLPFIPTPRDVATIFAAVLIAGVILALFSAWYRARTVNHFAKHTHFENARFSGNLTATGLIWLSITNFLIMIAGSLALALIGGAIVFPFIDFQNPGLTFANPAARAILAVFPLFIILGLSLFAPIIQARSTGYIMRNLSLTGTAPLAEIMQSAGADVKYGEGLAEAFDIDAV